MPSAEIRSGEGVEGAPAWVAEALESERLNVARGTVVELLGWFEAAHIDGDRVQTIVYHYASEPFNIGTSVMPGTSGLRYSTWAIDAEGRRQNGSGGGT